MLTHSKIGRVAIVGSGLAGCCLAWRVWQSGGKPYLFDTLNISDRSADSHRIDVQPSHAFPTASMVAGGLVTPIQGQRFATPAAYMQEFDIADEFYSSIENQTGESFWDKRQSVRFLQSAERAARFAKRQINSAGTHRDINLRIGEADLQIDAGDFRNEFSGFDMPDAARLRVGAFVRATLNCNDPQFEFAEHFVDPRGVRSIGSEVRLPGIDKTFDRIVFCTGTNIHSTPWTFDLEPRYAGGELLLVKLKHVDSATEELLDRFSAVHRQGWTFTVDQRDADLPLFDLKSREAVTLLRYTGETQANERLIMFGATYLDSVHLLRPRHAAIKELTDRFELAYRGPFEPLAISYGTRPIIAGRQPIARWESPGHRIGFFGGLASHGVRTAPTVAQKMIDDLC